MDRKADHDELLAGVPLFSGLSRRSLNAVAAATREVDHAAGHTVVRQGTSAHALHVIAAGTAEVTVYGIPIATLGPGDSFGEIALLDEGPRTATVTAVTPLRVLAVDGSTFRELVAADAELATSLVAHLAGLVRRLDVGIADCRAGGVFR